jgi:hypothetical protein
MLGPDAVGVTLERSRGSAQLSWLEITAERKTLRVFLTLEALEDLHDTSGRILEQAHEALAKLEAEARLDAENEHADTDRSARATDKRHPHQALAAPAGPPRDAVLVRKRRRRRQVR